jgi:hypothetical protein
VTIQNNGGSAMDPLSIELRGTGATQVQVSVLDWNCGIALEAGATCQVQLQYQPADATGVNAVLAVGAGSDSLAIAVVGVGQAVPVDGGAALDATTVDGSLD